MLFSRSLAGADALCLGHDIDAGHVARVRAAIVSAVREGRLSEGRLAEAAVRVASSHAPSPLAGGERPPLAVLGLEAARRALRVEGEVGSAQPTLVRRARRHDVRRGRAALSRSRVDHARSSARTSSPSTSRKAGKRPRPPSRHPGRRPVVVVRDVDRHPWQRAAVATIVGADARAVVVDVGYPSRDELPRGAGSVTTFGAGRASLTAAAERLLGL